MQDQSRPEPACLPPRRRHRRRKKERNYKHAAAVSSGSTLKNRPPVAPRLNDAGRTSGSLEGLGVLRRAGTTHISTTVWRDYRGCRRQTETNGQTVAAGFILGEKKTLGYHFLPCTGSHDPQHYQPFIVLTSACGAK